jgi:hypothetical protein
VGGPTTPKRGGGKNTKRAGGAGMSWADAKARHVNTRVSVVVPMASDAAEEAERLDPQLRRLRNADGEQGDLSEQVVALAEHIRDLERTAAESEVTFVFEGLPRSRWDKLLLDHPLPPELRKQLGADIDFNPETFPPALMAASCVEPAELHSDFDDAGHLDPEVLAEWTAINDGWSQGQVQRIWRACLQANTAVAEPPKSLLVSAVLALRDSETS